MLKNRKNSKFFFAELDEFEKYSKERKDSLRSFGTINKIDPTVLDEFTDEMVLPRGVETLSSHTREALVPVAVSRFSRFITVHVENVYGSARCIPYVVLYRGKGNGLIEMAKMCFKKNPSFKGRKLKEMREWRYPKIDLNELKKYGEKGVRYTREDMDMIPVDVSSLVKIRKITEVNDISII